MFHLRSFGGVNSGSRSSYRFMFGLQHFDLNLGSTESLAPVPSMSYLRSCGWCQLWIPIQLWIHICVVPFVGPLHLWIQSHLCLTLDYVGQGHLHSSSGDPYLGCNFYTLILGALHLWLQSYLCLTSEHGVQLWILINLWIHICVVP